MYFVIYVSDELSEAGFEIKNLLQLKADVMTSLLLIKHFSTSGT